MKKLFYIFIFVLLAIFVLLIKVFLAVPKNQVVVAYNLQSLNHGVAILAVENNYFQQSGLNVKMLALKSSKEIKQAVSAGHADIGFTSASNAFIAVSAGAPVKIIAPASLAKYAIFVREEDKDQPIAWLVKKKIVGGRGGMSEFVLRRALKKENIDFSSLDFLDIDNKFAGAALADKKIVDAAPASVYNQQYFRNFPVAELQAWSDLAYGKEYWPSNVIIANENFLRQNKNQLDKFIEAFIRSHEFIENSPEIAAEKIAKHINKQTDGVSGFTKEEVIFIWDSGISYALWYQPEILEEVAELMAENQMIENKIQLSDFFDFSYQDILRQKHNEIYESEN